MNASPGSVRVDDVMLRFLVGLGFLLGLGRPWGAMTMETYGMDSSGWPVAPGSKSSSHLARHGLSRRAFMGGAAAAAAGASLGSGLLWPAAASAGSFPPAPPPPTPATTTVKRAPFPLLSLPPPGGPPSLTRFKGFLWLPHLPGNRTA